MGTPETTASADGMRWRESMDGTVRSCNSHTRRFDAVSAILGRSNLDVQQEVISVLRRVLDLGPRSIEWTPDTALLGSVPELDSMAVATLITSLEEHFGFVVADDEIDGSTFATVGTLVDFVIAKRTA
jgi:acyl carrier protein